LNVGYTKVIKSGNIIEVYQYEKAPALRSYTRRRRHVQEKAADRGPVRPHKRRGDNLLRLRRGFIRLVRTNLVGDSNPAFLTLTMRSIVSLEAAAARYTRFAVRLKKAFGSDIRYIGVPEFQKRGAVHYHVLVWGIPPDVIVSERQERMIAALWGEGFVDCVLTDGSLKLAGYLGKYMTKSLLDERLGGKRAYYASRNILRPDRFKSAIILDHSQALWGVDNTLLHTAIFPTQWLGQGRYYRYQLNDT